MGRQKIDCTKMIENSHIREVTFWKRKKGLIKKAMELSMMCQQELYLVIYDKEQKRLITYQNDMSFNTKIVSKLV